LSFFRISHKGPMTPHMQELGTIYISWPEWHLHSKPDGWKGT